MKSHTKIFLFTTFDVWQSKMWICNWKCKSTYVKINRVNTLYLIFNKVNGYFEEINENNYLALVPSDESKETIKDMKNCGVKSEI